MPRILFIHGAATTAAVWSRTIARLDGYDVEAIDRPSTGNLDLELEWLAAYASGALVVGASGGATLCLALAASTIDIAAGIAHEPAVGSLLPELLAPVASAFAEGGAAGMGAALYGPLWRPEMAPDADAVSRDLGMFRAFEPEPPRVGNGRVLVTTGERSPDIRRLAADRLSAALGYDTATLPGCAHLVALEAPDVLAAWIAATADAIEVGGK